MRVEHPMKLTSHLQITSTVDRGVKLSSQLRVTRTGVYDLKIGT